MIKYIIGDATQPIDTNCPNHIIAHVCNDVGKWGKGFVLALSKMDTKPERKYKEWYHGSYNMKLGMVQIVCVKPGLYVSNMIGQRDIKNSVVNGRQIPPVRYEAIEECLRKTCCWAKKYNADIHMPKIGCGLAGGKWEIIEEILNRVSKETDIDFYVYDLPDVKS